MSATLSETSAATLFREGDDLDDVLAELDAEYPGQVHVTEVTYDRQGGVLGFFARRRVGVHFTLTDPYTDRFTDHVTTRSASRGRLATDLGDGAGSLEDLVRAAEAAEQPHQPYDPAAARLAAAMVESGRAAVPAHEDDLDTATTNLEFARMLLDMATQKAAERSGRADGAGRLAAPVAARVPVAAPVTAPIATPVAAPIVRPAAVGRPAAPAHRYAEASLDALARSRPVGAHRATDAPATNFSPATGAAATAIPTAPIPTAAIPAAAAVASVPGEEPGRSRFTLRRQLVELGVPVDWIPADSADSYWIIEQLVNRLPAAPALEPGLGEIVAIVGPAAEALRAARQLCARLRLPAGALHTAGCIGEPGVPTEAIQHSIQHSAQAASFAADLRRSAAAPAIVVVATDDHANAEVDGDDRWAAGIVAALSPEQIWLVVDATCKPADARAQLVSFGPVDALVVTAAARTTSPASVWQLHTPIAMLDGRPATRGAWAALLIDKLNALE